MCSVCLATTLSMLVVTSDVITTVPVAGDVVFLSLPSRSGDPIANTSVLLCWPEQLHPHGFASPMLARQHGQNQNQCEVLQLCSTVEDMHWATNVYEVYFA